MGFQVKWGASFHLLSPCVCRLSTTIVFHLLLCNASSNGKIAVISANQSIFRFVLKCPIHESDCLNQHIRNPVGFIVPLFHFRIIYIYIQDHIQFNASSSNSKEFKVNNNDMHGTIGNFSRAKFTHLFDAVYWWMVENEAEHNQVIHFIFHFVRPETEYVWVDCIWVSNWCVWPCRPTKLSKMKIPFGIKDFTLFYSHPLKEHLNIIIWQGWRARSRWMPMLRPESGIKVIENTAKNVGNFTLHKINSTK